MRFLEAARFLNAPVFAGRKVNFTLRAAVGVYAPLWPNPSNGPRNVFAPHHIIKRFINSYSCMESICRMSIRIVEDLCETLIGQERQQPISNCTSTK